MSLSVIIAGVYIPIELKPKRQMKESYGEFDHTNETINMRVDQPINLRRKSLVHECFHTYLYLSGFSSLLRSIDPNMEEAFCCSFEQAMSHMFAFSPEIEAWLVGEV
jgi:hypothetical protein